MRRDSKFFNGAEAFRESAFSQFLVKRLIEHQCAESADINCCQDIEPNPAHLQEVLEPAGRSTGRASLKILSRISRYRVLGYSVNSVRGALWMFIKTVAGGMTMVEVSRNVARTIARPAVDCRCRD